MSKLKAKLVIWWPATNQTNEFNPNLTVRYEVHGPNGKLHAGQEPLHALPHNLPCWVLLAPCDLNLIPVAPPKLSGKKLQTALSFLVEPFLLNNPEDNHVQLWGHLATVVQTLTLKQIVRTCQQAHIDLEGISCETLAPTHQDETIAWFSGEFLIWKNHSQPTPWVVPHDAKDMHQALFKTGNLTSNTIRLLAADEKRLQTTCPDLLKTWHVETLQHHPIEPFSVLMQHNLLTPQAQRQWHIGPSKQTSSLQPLALALSCLLAFAVISLNGLAWHYQHQQRDIETQIEKRFQQSIPNTPMIADPLLLIEREKKLLATQHTQSTQGVSQALHAVGQAMNEAPFNSMTQITWTDQSLRLEFSPNISPSDQDKALQNLKTQGIQAQWLNQGKNNPTLLIRNKASS